MNDTTPAAPVALARLDEAVRLLAACRTLDEVSHIRAMAQAAEEYARAEKLGEEAVRYATEIRVRAARKAGEMLRDMAVTGERASVGRPAKTSTAATISDLGITRDQSSDWQAIAAIPAPEFEEALATTEPLSEARLAMKVHYSSGEDDWHTPLDIVQRVENVLGSIDLDPCSNEGEPNVPAARHFTVADDGLAKEWVGRVYMNPPYGRVIEAWTEKLAVSHESGAVTEAIALVPARTDTAWFRRLRMFPRCFVAGRLRFSNSEAGAPFPSVAFYLGPNPTRFVEVFSPVGDVYELVTP